MIHMLEHAIEDTWLMLPLLYLSYIVIEYFERKKSNDDILLNNLQKYGPLLGALIGIIPQCGFSIIASMLFLNRYITLGTLISVFVATSDEAIPILISNPSLYTPMIWIIIIKVGLGILVGYIVDKVIYPNQKLILFSELEEDEEYEDDEYDDEKIDSNACPCCYTQYPLLISALLRTLKIFAFLFITTFVLNFIIHEVGEETLGRVLLNNSLFQPIFAASFGFIPNCAASVVLTQLYVAEQVSFASLVSGLITNAGLGIVMLIRYQATLKDLFRVCTILFISAVLCGITLQLMI